MQKAIRLTAQDDVYMNVCGQCNCLFRPVTTLWASTHGRVVKFPSASDACVVLQPRECCACMVCGYCSLCRSVFCLFLGTGRVNCKH